MKVVITGGSGFIGTNLMLWFGQNEPDTKVLIFDVAPPQVDMPPNAEFVYGDIRSVPSLLSAFAGADEVYHLAGILGTSELLSIPTLAADVNIVGAVNVLEAARIAGVARVYNVAKPHFESLHENAYTLTKNSGELMGLMYREKYGMNVSTVRWLNAVGPHQHLYPVRKLVPMMVLLAMYGYDLEIYGSGQQTIDPIDTRDMCAFTVYACRNLGGANAPDTVDLGSGSAITCNDTAGLIRDRVAGRLGVKVGINNVPMRPGEKEGVNLVADMSYWNGLGMRPEYSFEDSIEAVIDYIVKLPEYHRRNALRFYGKTV